MAKPQNLPPATAGQDDRPWYVEYHREPAKVIAEHANTRARVSPRHEEIAAQLARDPKRFPKKAGQLAGRRAAPLLVNGKSYRTVFTIDEETRTVVVTSIAPHDTAYRQAKRR